jgi:hypothetical protein
MKEMNILNVPDFNWETAKKTVQLGVAFSLMVISGLSGLALVNVPMFR